MTAMANPTSKASVTKSLQRKLVCILRAHDNHAVLAAQRTDVLAGAVSAHPQSLCGSEQHAGASGCTAASRLELLEDNKGLCCRAA